MCLVKHSHFWILPAPTLASGSVQGATLCYDIGSRRLTGPSVCTLTPARTSLSPAEPPSTQMSFHGGCPRRRVHQMFPAPPRPFSGTFGLHHVTQEPQGLSRLGVCPDHTAPKSTAVRGAGWASGCSSLSWVPPRKARPRAPLCVGGDFLRPFLGLSCPDLTGPPLGSCAPQARGTLLPPPPWEGERQRLFQSSTCTKTLNFKS